MALVFGGCCSKCKAVVLMICKVHITILLTFYHQVHFAANAKTKMLFGTWFVLLKEMVVMRFIFLMFLALVGCTGQSDTQRLSRSIDSLSSEIAKLRNELNYRDSVREKKIFPLNDTTTRTNVRVEHKPPKIIKRDTLQVRQKQKPQNDTLIYHFAGGGVSVKVFPWVDSKQLIEIYSLQGGVVITLENINLSYQVSNTLHFRSDGSLERVNEHFNPGASLYWYETETRFEPDNEPAWKITYRYPQMGIEDSMGEKYLWNRSQKRWVKQEIVIETIQPANP